MNPEKFSRAILKAERVGILLYVVLTIIGAAIVSLIAVSSNDPLTTLQAGISLVSGVVVLVLILYLETHVWNAK
jgi:heme/copper-type cytochrome/quinol oxidase subunit 4